MTICCLPVTHFKRKYSAILKDKGWKKMYHTNANQKKPRVYNNTKQNRFRAKSMAGDEDGNFITIKCSIVNRT